MEVKVKEEQRVLRPHPIIKEEIESEDFLQRGRLFYAQGKSAVLEEFEKKEGDKKAPKQLFPLLIYPYLDWNHIRYHYPLWISFQETWQAKPLPEWLENQMDSLFGDKNHSVLKVNLPLLEKEIREILSQKDEFQTAKDVFLSASQKTLEKLSLKGDEGEELKGDLELWASTLGEQEYFLPFSPWAAFQLFMLAYRADQKPKLGPFLEKMKKLKGRIRETLHLESAKTNPLQQSETKDYSQQFLNFQKLGTFLPKSGPKRMEPE
ncbi:MAG: hypothetical protein D6785_00435, partial [Planctomycetota bacterium]